MEDLEVVGDEGREQEEQVEEVVQELLSEAEAIRSSTGVGCPQIAKHVAAWADVWQGEPSDKAAALQSLAAQLHQRRPILYLKGSPEPVAATVLVRSVRKPPVAALSRGPAASASLFKAPDNRFILIKFDAAHAPADIIVDPFFTDAFVQQPSSPTLDLLLQRLPRAFVGTASELRRLVALLTSQSLRAYASNGASSPPWRRFDSMLARWLPKSFTDDVLGTSSNSSSLSGFSAWLQLSAGSVASDASSLGSTPSSVPAAGSSSGSSGSMTSRVSSVRTIYGFDLAAAAPSAEKAAAMQEAAAESSKTAVVETAAAAEQLPAAAPAVTDGALEKTAVAEDDQVEAFESRSKSAIAIRAKDGSTAAPAAAVLAAVVPAVVLVRGGDSGGVIDDGSGFGVREGFSAMKGGAGGIGDDGSGDDGGMGKSGGKGGKDGGVGGGGISGGGAATVSIKDLEVVGLAGVLAKWRLRLKDLRAAQQQQQGIQGAVVGGTARARNRNGREPGQEWGRSYMSSSCSVVPLQQQSWCTWQGCGALEAHAA